MDLVSIIITTYRGYDTLARAIQSCINQTYKNIEILVVDDNPKGSIERKKTKSVLDSFKDTRIRYLDKEDHVNGAHARNVGMRAARGEYISFLDDDDIYFPERIRKCVSSIVYSNCDGVYTGVLLTVGNKLTKVRYPEGEGNLQKALMLDKNLFGTGSNIFITAKSVKKTGYFDESFIRHQDVEYMLRFFDNFLICSINEILVIKVNSGDKNVPNVSNYLKAKQLLLNKFDYIIDGFSKEEQKKLYTNEANELYKIVKQEKNPNSSKLFLKYVRNYKVVISSFIKVKVFIQLTGKRVLPIIYQIRITFTCLRSDKVRSEILKGQKLLNGSN